MKLPSEAGRSEGDTDNLEAIRERWQGHIWNYGETQEGGRTVHAFLFQLDKAGHLIDVREPTDKDRAFLLHIVAAPGDAQTLLAEMDAARLRLDDRAPTLAAAVESAYGQQQELIAAYRANEAALHERIDRLKADVGAWWWIVNDLYQLGCLDCSNAACDRAREALVETHPGAALLAELSAARAVVGTIYDRMAALARGEESALKVIDGALATYEVTRTNASPLPDDARNVLRAFVEVYAGAPSDDMAKVGLFRVWLRACGVLGIKPPTTTPEDAGRQALHAAQIAARLGGLLGGEGEGDAVPPHD